MKCARTKIFDKFSIHRKATVTVTQWTVHPIQHLITTLIMAGTNHEQNILEHYQRLTWKST